MASCMLLLASCGAQLSSDPEDEHATLDAGAPGPWSAPAAVTVAATQAIEDDVTLTSNALGMVYAIADPTTGKKDLYYTSRTAIGAPWAPAVPLPFDRAASSEEAPRFSADDRTLYFASDRAADDGNLDIYAVSHTAAATAPWGNPEAVAPLTTAETEKWLSPCSDGHYVVAQSTAAGDTDLFEGVLGGGAPAPISALNTTKGETGAFLTADCLTLYFASFQVTPERIFVSHRASLGSPWQPPVQVDDFQITGGTGGAQEDPWLSADGRTFAFASDAAGNKDIYLSTR
jgi:hypothetical protein